MINILTLFIRSADALTLFALIIVCFTIAPSFCTFVESPKWLQKKGRVSQLMAALAYISRKNGIGLTEKEIYDPLFNGKEGYEFVKGRKVAIRVDQKNKEKSSIFNDLKQIFTNFKYKN